MEHVCGKGKYRQKVFCEELVWIDVPSSIPIPIQEDGASGVLETQLLLMLGKGWRAHPGHPAINRLGVISWAICIFSSESARWKSSYLLSQLHPALHSPSPAQLLNSARIASIISHPTSGPTSACPCLLLTTSPTLTGSRGVVWAGGGGLEGWGHRGGDTPAMMDTPRSCGIHPHPTRRCQGHIQGTRMDCITLAVPRGG